MEIKRTIHRRDEISPGLTGLFVALGVAVALILCCFVRWGCFKNKERPSRNKRRGSLTLTGDGHRRSRHRQHSSPSKVMPLEELDVDTGELVTPPRAHTRRR